VRCDAVEIGSARYRSSLSQQQQQQQQQQAAISDGAATTNGPSPVSRRDLKIVRSLVRESFEMGPYSPRTDRAPVSGQCQCDLEVTVVVLR